MKENKSCEIKTSFASWLFIGTEPGAMRKEFLQPKKSSGSTRCTIHRPLSRPTPSAASWKMLQIKFRSLMIQRREGESKERNDDMCSQHAMVFVSLHPATMRRRKMWKNMPRRSSSMKTFESNKYLIELCACFSSCSSSSPASLLSRENDFMIK